LHAFSGSADYQARFRRRPCRPAVECIKFPRSDTDIVSGGHRVDDEFLAWARVPRSVPCSRSSDHLDRPLRSEAGTSRSSLDQLACSIPAARRGGTRVERSVLNLGANREIDPLGTQHLCEGGGLYGIGHAVMSAGRVVLTEQHLRLDRRGQRAGTPTVPSSGAAERRWLRPTRVSIRGRLSAIPRLLGAHQTAGSSGRPTMLIPKPARRSGRSRLARSPRETAMGRPEPGRASRGTPIRPTSCRSRSRRRRPATGDHRRPCAKATARSVPSRDGGVHRPPSRGHPAGTARSSTFHGARSAHLDHSSKPGAESGV
jgi:hypothetical protein